jgi:glycosyltransferase involved in cell wall biosynthesis
MENISVIIPAFNRAGLIGETLRSLLNQTVQAKEIIVVDDGSQDGTADAVLEMLKLGEAEKLKISEGKPWPEIRVIWQENAGPGAARNRGLAESTGEFIHFFDSDDIAAPNKHEVQLRVLLETGADIAYGPWVIGRFTCANSRDLGAIDIPQLAIEREKTKDVYNCFLPDGLVLQKKGLPARQLLKALLTNWSIVPHACMFRRGILDRVGGFPTDIRVCEDQLMFLRCLLAGAKVVHSPGTLELYRLGTENKLTMRGSTNDSSEIDTAKFLIQANRDCETYGVSPTQWIGFRIRAWASFQEILKVCISCESSIQKELIKLYNPKQDIIYLLMVRFARWVSAAKAKLGLPRQNSCFQAGHLTESDKRLLLGVGVKVLTSKGRKYSSKFS